MKKLKKIMITGIVLILAINTIHILQVQFYVFKINSLYEDNGHYINNQLSNAAALLKRGMSSTEVDAIMQNDNPVSRIRNFTSNASGPDAKMTMYTFNYGEPFELWITRKTIDNPLVEYVKVYFDDSGFSHKIEVDTTSQLPAIDWESNVVHLTGTNGVSGNVDQEKKDSNAIKESEE